MHLSQAAPLTEHHVWQVLWEVAQVRFSCLTPAFVQLCKMRQLMLRQMSAQNDVLCAIQ